MGTGMAAGELLVIKLGGAAAEAAGALTAFIHELEPLTRAGARVVLVHGGGNEVSALTRRVGLEPQFSDGVRVTSPAEMPYVDMVLCGAVNKRLVRELHAVGLAAVGLSGSDGPIFTGARAAAAAGTSADANHTATVAEVDTRLLLLLLDHGYLPVLAPTSLEPPGRAVNINADSVALRLAPALAADRLLFLSDVPGVLKDGAVLPTLTPPRAAAEIAAGVIRGGMIPKLEAAVHALEQGVRRVVIGRFAATGDLTALLTGAAGTTILSPPAQQAAQQSPQEAQPCNATVR